MPSGTTGRPTSIRPVVDELDRVADRLVRLESAPLPEVRELLGRVDALLRAHVAVAAAPGESRGEPADSDHARFLVSLDQLWWFYSIVESEDHGGHRQALGQYGRLLAEALRRHLDEEERWIPRAPGGADARAAPAPSKP